MQGGPFDQFSKALYHRNRLVRIAQRDFLPPVSVKIELMNLCNHDCHFCAYRKIVQSSAARDILDTKRVLDLLDELADGGVEGVMFTGGGEPLLHPGLAEIFAKCRDRNLSYALITNGSRLHQLSDEDLGGMTWIRFSINAGNAQDYAKVYGVPTGRWDTVWKQVERTCQLARTTTLTVGVSMVVTTLNLPAMENVAHKARQTGAHYVHLRPAFRGPHTELHQQLSEAQIQDCLRRLQDLTALEHESFRIFGVQRRFQEIQAPNHQHIHCRSTPLVAYILPTGDVSLCTLVRTYDFSKLTDNPFLGNLYKDRFFDLWNTERHHKLIAQLSQSGCSRCHFAQYNRALEVVTNDQLHAHFL